MCRSLPPQGRFTRTLAAFFAVLVLASGAAHAQGTWSGANSAFWSDAGNWQGSVMPLNDPTGTALFPNAAQTAVDQNGPPWTLNTLTTTGAAYTFSGGELNFDGTGPAISVSSVPSTFNNQINWAVPLTLMANANITFTGAFLGTTGLVKQGPGVVTITTTLAVLGPVDVQAGVLTTSQANPDVTRSLNIASGASVNTGPAQWAELGGAGNLALQGATTIGGDNDSAFTGQIIGGFALTKANTGTQTLLGNNTWTGGTNVNGGMLVAGDGFSGTFPSGPVNLAGGSLLLAPTNVVNITALTGSGNVIVNSGVINVTGPWNLAAGDVGLNGGTVTAFGFTINGTLDVFMPATFSTGPATMRGLEGNGPIVMSTNFSVNNAATSSTPGRYRARGSS
jgi:autotransporter-associated beta strand protein